MTTEAIEDVSVTQRMAIDALAPYDNASELEKGAKVTKEVLSESILKPYLEENPNEVLWDGEAKIEGWLKPHGSGRWLDPKVPDAVLRWALEAELISLRLGAMDEMPDSPALTALKEYVNPGGTGTPRLHVGPREE